MEGLPWTSPLWSRLRWITGRPAATCNRCFIISISCVEVIVVWRMAHQYLWLHNCHWGRPSTILRDKLSWKCRIRTWNLETIPPIRWHAWFAINPGLSSLVSLWAHIARIMVENFINIAWVICIVIFIGCHIAYQSTLLRWVNVLVWIIHKAYACEFSLNLFNFIP